MVNAPSDYKNLSNRNVKKYQNSQTERLLQARFKNVKLYWKLLNNKSHTSNNKIDIADFYNYFLSLSDPEEGFYSADPDISDELNHLMQNEMAIMFEELNVPIDIGEIEAGIKQLKMGKSAGEDLMINEFFTHGKNLLLPYFHSLFNYVFETGHFPSIWSDGLVKPLHKKGSYLDTSNYRGITLLSTLGKLFTRVINNRLDSWANDYHIYIEAQYGFRKGRGTVDCMFVLNGIVNKFVQNSKKVYTFFC